MSIKELIIDLEKAKDRYTTAEFKKSIKGLWDVIVASDISNYDDIRLFFSLVPNKKIEFIDDIPKVAGNFWDYIPDNFKKVSQRTVKKLDSKGLATIFSNATAKTAEDYECYKNKVFVKENNIVATDSYLLLNLPYKNSEIEQGLYRIEGGKLVKSHLECNEPGFNGVITDRLQTDSYETATVNIYSLASYLKIINNFFKTDRVVLKTKSDKYFYTKALLNRVVKIAMLLGWKNVELFFEKSIHRKTYALPLNLRNVNNLKDCKTPFILFMPAVESEDYILYYDTVTGTVKTNEKYVLNNKLKELKKLAEVAKRKMQNLVEKQADIILQSIELAGLEYKLLETDGMFHELVGDPSLPFYIMLYGLPGSGKSTLTLQLAKYLAEKGLRVLYYAKEESGRHGFSYTLKEKLDRLNAYHENLFFANSLPENLQNYDVLVIDSVNDAGLTYEQLENLQNRYPQLSMLLIFQSTKNGNFRGEQKWQHLVDVVVKVEQGTATTGKNRFGKVGAVEIF